MPKIQSLSFIKLKSNSMESLKGKCDHNHVYVKVWNMVKRRNDSPLDANNAIFTQKSPLTSDVLNCWK